MSEWEDIRIVRHDKERSERPTADDFELSRQVFVLSEEPPQRWVEICNVAFGGTPGRLGRESQIKGRYLHTWGGPRIFDERDANHLKQIVAYANERYREILAPVDLSGLAEFA